MKQMKLKGHTDTVHALLFRHDGAQVAPVLPRRGASSCHRAAALCIGRKRRVAARASVHNGGCARPLRAASLRRRITRVSLYVLVQALSAGTDRSIKLWDLGMQARCPHPCLRARACAGVRVRSCMCACWRVRVRVRVRTCLDLSIPTRACVVPPQP